MPSAKANSGDSVLARARLASFFLDIRSLPNGTALKEWLHERHAFYSVGAQWNDTMLESNAAVFAMGLSFDGLVFFREGTASGWLQ